MPAHSVGSYCYACQSDECHADFCPDCGFINCVCYHWFEDKTVKQSE